MRAEALLVLGLALTAGCIDDLLEAPYVLTTGLGQGGRSLAPSVDQKLYVAGQAGVYEVDGEGKPRQLLDRPVRLASAHLGFLAVADDRSIDFGAAPEPDQTWTATSTVPVTDVRDAQAWCDLQLLLLTPGQLQFVRPGDSAPRAWTTAPADARAITLGPSAGGEPCEHAVVLTGDAAFAVSPDAQRPLVTGLVDARAVAVDKRGEVWVVHGQPPVLARVRDGRAETIARHVGEVVDMHFGTGQLLHPDNAYLLTAQGSIDYVRVPGGEG